MNAIERFWRSAYTLRGFHIIPNPPRRGGGSFYRDQSLRELHTLCGAPVSPHDCWVKDTQTKTHGPLLLRHCCTQCAKIMAEQKGK